MIFLSVLEGCKKTSAFQEKALIERKHGHMPTLSLPYFGQCLPRELPILPYTKRWRPRIRAY